MDQEFTGTINVWLVAEADNCRPNIVGHVADCAADNAIMSAIMSAKCRPIVGQYPIVDTVVYCVSDY